MSPNETLRASFQAAASALREFPARAAAALNRWVMDQHQPLDIHEDGTVLICLGCRKNTPWPCEHYMRAADALAAIPDSVKETQQP